MLRQVATLAGTRAQLVLQMASEYSANALAAVRAPQCVFCGANGASNVHTTSHISHGDPPDPNAPTINVNFVDRDGTNYHVKAAIGQSMLEVAHKNDIDLEGACEGSLACSTCHVIVDDDHFDLIPEADDDENDMLDLAFGLTDKSRLGCQVIAKEDLDGMVLKIPSATRNFAVDGHRPKPH